MINSTWLINLTKRECMVNECLPLSMLWPNPTLEVLMKKWRGDEVIIFSGKSTFFYMFEKIFPLLDKENKDLLLNNGDDMSEEAKIRFLLEKFTYIYEDSQAAPSTLLVNNSKKEIYKIDKVNLLPILLSGGSVDFESILTDEGKKLIGTWIGDDLEHRKKMLKKYEKHYQVKDVLIEELFTPAFIELAGWNDD